MNTHDVPRVLIVGHSFISHLATDIQVIPRLHSNFNLIQCTVRCCGISGARINTIMQNYTLVSCLSDYKPHIVLLQIGGNDICNHHLHPETLAFQIIDFMTMLRTNYNVSQVIICELFYRHNPRGMPADMYEQRKCMVNNILNIVLENRQQEYFWKHLHLMNSPMNILCQNGVHLSALGTIQFYRSVRMAILHALDYLT